MMACVLHSLSGTGMLDPYPNLVAYLARCQARPAYRRALAAHMADFTDQPPIAA
jgi:glutathione S-transferase